MKGLMIDDAVDMIGELPANLSTASSSHLARD